MADFILQELLRLSAGLCCILHRQQGGIRIYILNKARWLLVYVANSVQGIWKSMELEQWKSAWADENPASNVMRMVAATQLMGTNWFMPPDFLGHNTDPTKDFVLVDLDHEKNWGLGPAHSYQCACNKRPVYSYFTGFSSWQSLHSTVASPQQENEPQLEAGGLQVLLRSKTVTTETVHQGAFIQKTHCIHEKSLPSQNGSLRKLDPFLCTCGLFPVGGCLYKGDIPVDRRNSLIIPGWHHVSTHLVHHCRDCVRH